MEIREMEDRLETILVDTDNEMQIDCWTGEWLNEDAIMNNLIDEATVLTIASEKVKKRLLSVSKVGKEYKDKYEKLREKYYDQESKLKNLEKEMKSFDEKVNAKAMEILKDKERELYGFAIGDKAYQILYDSESEQLTCPVCQGKGRLEINGYDMECPYCRGRKTIFKKVKDIYTIRECTVEHNNVRITIDSNDYTSTLQTSISLSYIDPKTGRKEHTASTEWGVKTVCRTKEEAEEWIKNKLQEQ